MARARLAAGGVVLLFVLFCACNSDGENGSQDAGNDRPDLRRIDASVLSRAIELTPGPGRVESRGVIFDRKRFVVWWVFTAFTEKERRVMFARVDEVGTVVDGPKDLMVLDHEIADPRLLPTAEGFTLLQRKKGRKGQVSATKLDERGNVLTSFKAVESYSTGSHNLYRDGLGGAWSGQRYRLLVGESETASGKTHYRLKTRSFEKDLAPVGPSALVDPQNEGQFDPQVSWLPLATGGKGAFWLLWRGGERIRAALVDEDGKMLQQPGLLLDENEAQKEPRVILHDRNRALVSWIHADRQSPRFLLFDAATVQKLWSQPAAWLPQNRVARLRYGVALRGDRAVCAWESDAETSLPGILVGEVDLSSSAPSLAAGDVIVVSDPAYPAYAPRVAAGTKVFAVIFSSAVNGSGHLYIRLLP